VTRRNIFKRMWPVLVRLVMGDNVLASDIAGFSPEELYLFTKVVATKSGSCVPDDLEKMVTQRPISKTVRKFIDEKGGYVHPKRKEERTKYIFKLVIKLLLTDKFGGESEMDRVALFTHYFANDAKKKRLPMDDYWEPSYQQPYRDPGQQPLNSRIRQNIREPTQRFKSINSEYLDLVFSVPAFRRDFLECLTSPAFECHVKQAITDKVARIVNDLNAKLKKISSEQERVDEIKRRFGDSKRAKLPWTFRESLEARDKFLTIMELKLVG